MTGLRDHAAMTAYGIDPAASHWPTPRALRSVQTPSYDETAPTVHFVIPDTQVKPGVPTVHLSWIGRYLVDQFAGQPNVKVVHLGDHADMASLSSYDKGKKAMEGRRYVADIDAANAGFDILNNALVRHNRRRRKSKNEWWPERHFLIGNHEERITRACESDPQLDGLLSLDHLNYAAHGWTVHDYLQPVELDGIAYAHFFYHPMTGRPFAGTIENRIKHVGCSFTMGHQQQLLYGIRYALEQPQHGLVAGACYLHDEDYKGPQGNAHWRGVIVCHEVRDGRYDPMFVSLNYLCRKYEGVPLSEFSRTEKNFSARENEAA